VVIDGDLEIPLDSQIVQSGREQPTLLICSDQADAQKEDLLLASGVQVMRIPGDRHEIPLQEVLSRLAAINVCSVLVEGGGEINSYLLMNRLADKIYWFIAPKIVGGRGAPSPVGGSGREKMSDALGLTITEIKRFSRDILFIGYL
jgi:diaminohydroxyphosphoribosylaminopyrimidine deaminase/5-amino-6-(5-phosphoribosylamino)uracil reductase